MTHSLNLGKFIAPMAGRSERDEFPEDEKREAQSRMVGVGRPGLIAIRFAAMSRAILGELQKRYPEDESIKELLDAVLPSSGRELREAQAHFVRDWIAEQKRIMGARVDVPEQEESVRQLFRDILEKANLGDLVDWDRIEAFLNTSIIDAKVVQREHLGEPTNPTERTPPLDLSSLDIKTP